MQPHIKLPYMPHYMAELNPLRRFVVLYGKQATAGAAVGTQQQTMSALLTRQNSFLSHQRS